MMSRQLPPGPNDGFFGIRFAGRLKSNLLETYRQLHRDYGDRVFCRVGPFRIFFFFHPDDIHEALVTHSRALIRDPRPMKVFAQWNGNSLIISEGEQWLRQRRMVQPAFQQKRFPAYGEKMALAIEGLRETLAGQATHHGFVDVDIDEVMTALTLDIICQTLFSTDLKSKTAEIRSAVATLAEIAYFEVQQLFIWPMWLPTARNRRKKRAIHVLDSVIRGLIQERRKENCDKGDLLSMLLSVVDDEGDGGQMTDEQVRNEAMTLMLAGHDTTAAGLDWLWMLLATHPDAAERCREELRQVCGGRRVRFEDLSALPTLHAVIRESLRLYPPAVSLFLRKTTQDIRVGDVEVPQGSLIIFSPLVTHYDARWFPEPDTFDLDRFLPPRADSIPHQAWFPFGAGPRICIGQSFAMMEMQLIAATLLQSFDVSLVPGHTVPEPYFTAALRPRTPLLIRFRNRDSAQEIHS